jgi:iron complex outermembrane recepter protein
MATPIPGNEIPNVPNHTASLWTTYAFSHSAWNGLAIGAGFQYASDRFGLSNNSVEVYGYLVLNAALSYWRERWRMSLSLNNLTDKEYIKGGPDSTDIDVTPRAPFNAVASVSYAF